MSAIDQVVVAVLGGYKRATKYMSDKHTIKATRRGKLDKRSRAIEVLVTIGKPNYAERQFIKDCKKAGEPFPVKKIQVK